MANSCFQFKQFTVHQDRCAMKVTTDACLFGAWVAREISNEELIINNCLDIGTGSGLLALMLAQKISATINCIEIDPGASQQARENACASPWKDRIKVINADVKSFIAANKYDLIISNPPFYENEIRSSNDSKNIAHHSEELKLYQLLAIIKKYLTSNGRFFLLLPYKRTEEVKRLFRDHGLQIDKIEFVRQSASHDYFRIMLKGGFHPPEGKETEFDEIFICDEEQEYTSEFTGLLKDYYLYL